MSRLYPTVLVGEEVMMCNESVIISRNEYDLLKTNAENNNITINIGEYDHLKDRSNMLQLVCRILEKKEYCEDELRMILGVEKTEVVNG